ncbi:MAG: transcription termination factor NusA [Verrucomicrobiota bacterium]|nr:transcription termination factor NusA [Verrucomicrobiota bacterium]
MNGDFLAVLDYYEKEKGIDRQVLIEAVENAILTASKKSVGPARDLRVVFDPKSGNIKAFATLRVVENVRNQHGEIALTKAIQTAPDAKIGDDVEVEVTPTNFGRIAAQTAKQAMLQRIRQAERDKIFEDYQDREGDILTGNITRFDRGDLIVDLGGAEGVLPERERVANEEYNLRERIRAYVVSIRNTTHGPEIILSRSHPGFVRRLFELEVSEIYDGTVEIKAVAREAGFRTKVAVVSHDEKVDPVGACVGMRGVRVKNIVRELNGEKIDIVRWNSDIRMFVTEALQPARFKEMEIDERHKRIRIIVEESQLSLAIGRRGQNARLASKLTGWRIDVEREISPEMALEMKIEEAIDGLVRHLEIDRTLAGTLARAGIVTPDGLMAVELDDLIGIGLTPESAQELMAKAATLEPPFDFEDTDDTETEHEDGADTDAVQQESAADPSDHAETEAPPNASAEGDDDQDRDPEVSGPEH